MASVLVTVYKFSPWTTRSHISVVLWKAQLFISTHDPTALTASQVNVTFDLCHVLLAHQGTQHAVGVVRVTDLYLSGIVCVRQYDFKHVSDFAVTRFE